MKQDVAMRGATAPNPHPLATPPILPRDAFTLIELLVVIAIVAISRRGQARTVSGVTMRAKHLSHLRPTVLALSARRRLSGC